MNQVFKIFLIVFSGMECLASDEISPTIDVSIVHPLVQMQDENNRFAAIQYKCSSSMTLDMIVYERTPANVRTLFSNKLHSPGQYEINWDGTTDFGILAADGYYFIKIIESGTGRVLFDSAFTDWGKASEPEQLTLIGDGRITYRLKTNSLVWAGVGNKGSEEYFGPVLDWVAKPAGVHTDYWDGRDQSGKVFLLGLHNLGLQMHGYTLPTQTIFVQGSKNVLVTSQLKESPYVTPQMETTNDLIDTGKNEALFRALIPLVTFLDDRGQPRNVDFLEDGKAIEARIELSQKDLSKLDGDDAHVQIYVNHNKILDEIWKPESTFQVVPPDSAPGHYLLNVNVCCGKGCHIGSFLTEIVLGSR